MYVLINNYTKIKNKVLDTKKKIVLENIKNKLKLFQFSKNFYFIKYHKIIFKNYFLKLTKVLKGI